MTLVLSLLNESVAIHLSDRRLTGRNGPVTDEANKTTFLNAFDCRLVMGFSGLARAGNIDIEERILNLLLESAPPDYQWQSMRGRFTKALDDLFQEAPIRRAKPEDRATSMHLVGFMRTEPPLPTSTFISNHNDPVNRLFANPPTENFRETTVYGATGDPTNTLIQAIGMYGHVGPADVEPLSKMLKEGRPAVAIVAKGVELFRRWADHPAAQGTIGKQTMSVVLPSDHTVIATARYHTAVVQPTAYLMSEVQALPWASYAARGGRIVETSGGPGAVPPAGRNEPCPCGSGKKYKRCHGGPAARQIAVQIEALPSPPTRY